MNSTLELLNARFSTRTFAARDIEDAEKAAILHGAMRAPTAGNMMMYTIIEVVDQALKDRLAQTCDDQPFIAKAPLVLVFVADMQKWVDLFRYSHAERVEGVTHRSVPDVGDLMMACSDALIAAQNAVIAAESLGIGSCYIGDVLENGEIHAALLGLPQHTLPVAMLCLGYPAATREPTPHYERHMVHVDGYHRLSDAELAVVSEELGKMQSPHGFAPGIENIGQHVYRRKFTPAFMDEMNRSARWWIDRWCTPEAGD